LLGHSLGGIVIKQVFDSSPFTDNLELIVLQALIEMQHGDESDKANLKSIHGILFFGVPSQGMSVESLVPMVENQPNRFFLESLSKVTDGLRAQRRNFRQVFPFRDSLIISFYETKQSPTAKKVSQVSPCPRRTFH
jgi:protein SERAC1